jgi:Xaa-Pro dipeptidase
VRAARLQSLIREAGFDGVLITHNADVFYLSGAVQQAQLYLPSYGSPLLMVRKHPGRAADSSALERSLVAVRSLRELPSLIQGAGPVPKRIGFLFDTLPVSTYEAYRKALAPLGAELGDASMLVRRARATKSEYEVEQIRRAADVADAGVRAAAQHLREGATEVVVAAQVEAALRMAGHSGTLRIRFYGQEMHMGHLLAGASGGVPSFMNSPTGGYGQGPWAPYGAGQRTVGRGEPVFLDYCGEWGGYIADQTRMLSVGRLSDFWLDGFAAMRAVQDHLEREVRPGVTSGQVFEMAVAEATSLGYGDNFMGPPEEESPGQRVPFVGHGVGLELDEWPPLQRGGDVPLEAGMVLAIEPKLIYTGRGAIGIEDTYLLTESGLVSLTHSSREIVEVP